MSTKHHTTHKHGQVAAGDKQTAEVGAAVLAKGGNAVDAAMACTLAACASEPILTGLFGGGFAVVAGPSAEKPPVVVDFFAEIPGRGLTRTAAATELDFIGLDVDFGATQQTFHVGRAATATPHMLAGLALLQREHGRLPLAEVVAPARDLAEKGCIISPAVAAFFAVLRPILLHTPNTRALFAPEGTLIVGGERYHSPELAPFLDRFCAQAGAENAASTGDQGLLDLCAPPHGLLTPEDLHHKGGGPLQRTPIRVEFGDYEVLLNPLPSSGGLLVAFSLLLLRNVNAEVWLDDTQTYKHLIAAMATASAARSAELDPAIGSIALAPEPDKGSALNALGERFLSDDFMNRWRGYFEQTIRQGPPEIALPPVKDPGGTTHISVIDGDGMACSITSSNGEGNGYVVEGAGCMANNFMGEEDLHPGGFHTLPVGTRLTSMMCPTILMHKGRPHTVLGTGGSNRIRTAVLQMLVALVLRQRDLKTAVEAPRLHYEGNVLFLEHVGPGATLDDNVVHSLEDFVHETVVFEAPNMFFGGVHAVNCQGEAVGDPRRGGSTAKG